MAYASVEDVKAILPDDEDEIPDPAPSRLIVGLDEATDTVIGYLGGDIYTGTGLADPDEDDDGVPDDVPGAVRRVTARVALRAFKDAPENPGAMAETNLMGPFSHTINWSKEAQARDFYLTDSDKLRLDRFRSSGSGAVSHAPMYAEPLGFRYG